MVDGKINIRIGKLEIGYEGSEEYIKNDLLNTVEKVKEMFDLEQINTIEPQKTSTNTANNLYNTDEGTVTSISSKLNVNSGPDLVIATATYLQVIQGYEEFTRKQIIDNMKDAKGYYKPSYSSNLSSLLSSLVKQDQLIEIRTGIYTLSAGTKKDLEGKLSL